MKTNIESKKRNFRKEHFIKTGAKLIKELDKIVNKLKFRMSSKKYSFSVKKLSKTKSINGLWNGNFNSTKKGHEHKDYAGIYAFAIMRKGVCEFQYIGISQTILRRFYDHTKLKPKNKASWAFLMAKHKYNLKHNLPNAEEMIPKVQEDFIRSCKFTFLPISNSMLMHIAEVYCVNKLKSKWNTFETH